MNPQLFGLFWFLNLATFGFTELVTVFLLSSFRLFLLLAVPLYLLIISYFCSMTILSPTTTWSYFNLSLLVSFVFFKLLLVYALLLFSKTIHRTMAEIKCQTWMCKALHVDDDVGIVQRFLAPWMFCTQYILDSVFAIWMPSA
ncbi:hypothetical protein V6N13_060231 [Hibiscus sabdariffa]